MKFLILIALAAVAAAYPQRQQDRATLKFKVLGRDLPGKDKILNPDPYAIIYYVEGDSSSKTEVGRTDWQSTTKNPDWPNTFTFNYDRSKNQRFLIKVYDHDYLSFDDKAGEVWVSVNDYVDRGERIEANLNKHGYIIIERVN